MKLGYKHTLFASYIGYIVQSLACNLIPLLFVIFSDSFGISLTKLGTLVFINFALQLLVDLVAAKYIDKIGYKRGAVLAHLLAFAGLFLLGVLPFIMPAFWGIALPLVLIAIGGGMTEVVISPIVEALPLKNKASHMSLLHSFFCWGSVITVLFSTLYFEMLGTINWRFLPMLWSIIPLVNIFYFSAVTITIEEKEDSKLSFKSFLSKPAFLLMMVLMTCGGAAEMAMSQWASFFAESGLNVSKTAGDLLGPCSFAVLMGSARIFFAKNEKRINLKTALMLSSALCMFSYALAALSPLPVLSLVGAALCGLSVGLMWPGVLSLSAKKFGGSGKMFALLAFAGDLGCTLGPFLLSLIADYTDSLKMGLLFVIIFPAIMLAVILKERKNNV